MRFARELPGNRQTFNRGWLAKPGLPKPKNAKSGALQEVRERERGRECLRDTFTFTKRCPKKALNLKFNRGA